MGKGTRWGRRLGGQGANEKEGVVWTGNLFHLNGLEADTFSEQCPGQALRTNGLHECGVMVAESLEGAR